MSKTQIKTIITIAILIIALVQCPFIYYYTYGFFKLFAMFLFGFGGVGLTILLLISLIVYKTTNTKFHVIGLVMAFVIGLSTISGDVIEYLDWNLRKTERNKIVNEVKKGILKPNDIGVCKLSIDRFPPISNNNNTIEIDSNNGMVSVKFFIDRGFIDHYSAFLYTNDTNEISVLKNGNNLSIRTFKKLDDNWYRVGY